MPANAPSAKAPPDGLVTALIVATLVAGLALVPRMFVGSFAATEGPLVGKPAPAFSLPVVVNATPGQSSIALADLKGSAVILDFWATFCGPCKAEAPIVNSVANRFRDRGLTVIGIDTSEPAGLGGPWARAHHLDYTIAYDSGSEAASDYGVTALPTLVVISRTGQVIAVREGVTDADELESLVKKAL
jgi:cytochrome c biogenesis protein CcmG/thiol:disulfide interchange protein DsbE